MLPDQVLQLLTAFIDGELSQRRKAVMRLLHKSSEARDFVQQLQKDAHKLKQMPKHKAEPSMKDQIMQAIVEQLSQPSPPAPSRGARRRWLPYIAAGLAACLLIGTIGVVYWKSMVEPNNNVKDLVENRPEVKPDNKPKLEFPPTTNKQKPPVSDMIAAVYGGFGQPVPVELPFSARFNDFVNPTVAAKFSSELTEKRAIQLEVTVKNDSMALARLKNILKYHNIAVVEDPSVSKSLNNKSKTKVEYLVYAENITTGEMAKLMRELGEGYVLGEGTNQRDVATPYQQMKLTPITNDDRSKLAKSLGVDPATMEPKENKNGKPDAKRVAVLLPTNGAAAPSPEMKRFASERRPLPPGAMQVLIKIRQE